MREILSIHVGGTGIHLGESIWNLLYKEGEQIGDKSEDAFFGLNSSNQRIPRALLVDLDSSSIDFVENSKIFKQNQVYKVIIIHFK
jgi:hypothetical protein